MVQSTTWATNLLSKLFSLKNQNEIKKSYKLFILEESVLKKNIYCIPEYRDFSTAEIGFLPNLVNLKGKMLQNMPK